MPLARPLYILLSAVLLVSQPLQGQTPPNQPLRYSVLVASMATLDDARSLQLEHNTDPVPFYIVPVQVNRAVYYRVLAGMFADRNDAVSLMNDLVARGVKESASAWHVRETALAFALGSYSSETESRTAVAAALNQGIPAYRVVTSIGGNPSFVVLAGGFENETEAAYLAGALSERGMPAGLEERRGLLPMDAGQVSAEEALTTDEEPPSPTDMDAPPADERPPVAEENQATPPVQEAETTATDENRAGAMEESREEQGVLSGALPSRPLPPPAPQRSVSGFAFSVGAMGGASPGLDAVHAYGGVTVHPRLGRFGLLGYGMIGQGAGYDSMSGFGALSLLLGEYGPLGIWAYGGYGYYEETGILDDTRGMAVPAAGGLLTYQVGNVEIMGGFTAMFGTFEEPGISIDFQVYRASLGVGFATSREAS
ncbi:MAG: SPOR domain-containing protein [Gemmatimonadetes bacterium]|nr:SPOR domain-containing protein [Gemmatimonadota bacterium]